MDLLPPKEKRPSHVTAQHPSRQQQKKHAKTPNNFRLFFLNRTPRRRWPNNSTNSARHFKTVVSIPARALLPNTKSKKIKPHSDTARRKAPGAMRLPRHSREIPRQHPYPDSPRVLLSASPARAGIGRDSWAVAPRPSTQAPPHRAASPCSPTAPRREAPLAPRREPSPAQQKQQRGEQQGRVGKRDFETSLMRDVLVRRNKGRTTGSSVGNRSKRGVCCPRDSMRILLSSGRLDPSHSAALTRARGRARSRHAKRKLVLTNVGIHYSLESRRAASALHDKMAPSRG